LAYYHLARADDIMYFLGLDHTPERLALAEKAVRAMHELRPVSGEAHLAQAQHFYWGYRDYDKAKAELVIAKQALPNEPLVLVLSGYIDRRQGRWDDSNSRTGASTGVGPTKSSSFSSRSLIVTNICDVLKIWRLFLDRVVAISPNDLTTRVQRAFVDFAMAGGLKTIARRDPSCCRAR